MAKDHRGFNDEIANATLMEVVNIGTADPNRADTHQNFVVGWHWYRAILYDYLASAA
jgi:hypothetical protein